MSGEGDFDRQRGMRKKKAQDEGGNPCVVGAKVVPLERAGAILPRLWEPFFEEVHCSRGQGRVPVVVPEAGMTFDGDGLW